MAICSYAGCGSPADLDGYACAHHAAQFAAGDLDWCSACDRLKPAEAPFCDECSTWDDFIDDSPLAFDFEDEWDQRVERGLRRPRSRSDLETPL